VAAAANTPVIDGKPVQTAPITVAGVVGLWVGLVGAAALVSSLWGTRRPGRDFRLRVRPWPDVPLGIAIGLACQYGLIQLVYLPFRPFFPQLDKSLSHETVSVTAHAHTTGLVVVSLVVVVGAPLVEELFFRGLLLRGLDRSLARFGRRLGPVLAVVVMGVAFGAAHLQLLPAFGLAIFGMVLGALAYGFKRLGPGVVTHATFNLLAVLGLLYPKAFGFP
jgi:membrane protease YdiL (CAAX protease family)